MLINKQVRDNISNIAKDINTTGDISGYINMDSKIKNMMCNYKYNVSLFDVTNKLLIYNQCNEICKQLKTEDEWRRLGRYINVNSSDNYVYILYCESKSEYIDVITGKQVNDELNSVEIGKALKYGIIKEDTISSEIKVMKMYDISDTISSNETDSLVVDTYNKSNYMLNRLDINTIIKAICDCNNLYVCKSNDSTYYKEEDNTLYIKYSKEANSIISEVIESLYGRKLGSESCDVLSSVMCNLCESCEYSDISAGRVSDNAIIKANYAIYNIVQYIDKYNNSVSNIDTLDEHRTISKIVDLMEVCLARKAMNV